MYTKLCDLLATENWQEADNETAEIIFQLSKQEYKMSSEYANNVSADDFRIIDKLWLKYSKGRFGFSVQKRIWQEESEESDKLGEFDNNKIYARFCEAVGWRVINGCLLSSYLNFTLNAPLGHFPVAVAGQGWSAASFLESLTWKL
ncbi:MAG: GUN4 domain-containing protein [Mastigocoleus sp. MO_167.B18]|nr:GUN4 domain-containing protein [Mastigocoleus sp. MO_167.B18]